MEQKGSMLLKVASIIMMVGGIVTAVASLFVALGATVWTAAVSEVAGHAVVGNITALIWIAVVLSVATAVAWIYAGATGKANWNNPEKAQFMFTLGIICAAIAVLGGILMSIGTRSFQISVVTDAVIPVLYIVGANQLKSQN